MVNSNVPRYSSLASEMHRNDLFKFKFVLSSVRSNNVHDGSVVQTDYELVQFQLQQLTWSSCTASIHFERWLQQCFRKKSNMYHISEPKIRRFFSKTCVTLFTSEQFSLIHSALQWNAATLRKVLAPFSFSHVIDSRSLFISFLIFPILSWFFFNSGLVFNKAIILLGLAGYQMIITNSALRTSLVI